MNVEDLAWRYWYLITANPVWLIGLWPDLDPRSMTPAAAIRAAAQRLQQAAA